MSYQPITISGYKTGLIEEITQDFLLPNDGYTRLENMYCFEDRIQRKTGARAIGTTGRLRRVITAQSLGNSAAAIWNFNIFTLAALPNDSGDIAFDPVTPSSLVRIDIGAEIITDDGLGTLTGNISATGTINYATGDVSITHANGVAASTIDLIYYPSFPVIGLRTRELAAINNEQTIAFDQRFAYRHVTNEWEDLPSTTPTVWNGTDYDLMWTTNFWTDNSGNKFFWATNGINSAGNEIRYYDGTTWATFLPQIFNKPPNPIEYMVQCKMLIPYRGRLVAFNTYESTVNAIGTGRQFPQRIRWAAIGNPLDPDAWKDSIVGKGGFLDIPTSQHLISIGFVRDNLIMYCERSTWKLSYTGNQVQPFQIERVNSELGAESRFSTVQFDLSLAGIGDKGIVSCDSFQSTRIDQKIRDFVYLKIKNESFGVQRVYGIRDFQRRLAYWTYPDNTTLETNQVFSNRILVYDYETESWANFTDSFTCLGNFQKVEEKTWQTQTFPWSQANFRWVNKVSLAPQVAAGNQRGFTFIINSTDSGIRNYPSLAINGVANNNPVQLTSINHNLQTGQIIELTGIIGGYSPLNDRIYKVEFIDKDTVKLLVYNAASESFDTEIDVLASTYLGGGRIEILDNINITTKKFSYIEEGSQIQMGYVDFLLDFNETGEMTLEVYQDYDNHILNDSSGDLFFNTVIPMNSLNAQQTLSKVMQRVYCLARATFLFHVITFSEKQMQEDAQHAFVQINAQTVWVRPAGSLIYTGGI